MAAHRLRSDHGSMGMRGPAYPPHTSFPSFIDKEREDRVLAEHVEDLPRCHRLIAQRLSGLHLIALADKAERAGIAREAVLLDGGIGFNKSADEDWYLLDHYEMLAAAGYPLLLGTSRKSMFGGAPESRLTATMESSALAAKKGILFVRVHDVRENLIAIRAAKGERL